MLLPANVAADDIEGLYKALKDVIAEGAEGVVLARLLADIIAAGCQADWRTPPTTFDVWNNGSENVQDAIFRVNAIMCHATMP